jgi:hypothetical protein
LGCAAEFDVALYYMPSYMKFQIVNTLIVLGTILYVRIKLNRHFQRIEERFEERKRKKNMYKRIECKDGFSMSVQAGSTHYSEPRNNKGPYTHVECGFPSEYEELIIAYAESRHEPTKSVYGWVPVGVVTTVIAKHGGLIGGEVPDGVAPLKGAEID